MNEGENMSKKVEIKITSKIHQEDESAVFERDGLGSIEKVGEDWRIKYREKDQKEGKKVQSPYTIEHKKKMSIWPFVVIPIVIGVLFLVIYLIVSTINKAPVVDTELMPEVREEYNYEFTY